ncbi:colicin V production protein [Rugosibacter aromaticivorans]|uniref:Colicin V production protein n=1 Tax=Rugosibacter aromaticivorans TaxID=1565605 RepID=A0A0C5J8L0_9PROT|nr:CvpA family protein [Rugosibacter aromaticivorans]AJP48063.1 colicin V production protein [Rugosibacter aromaticivorans]TBR16312.1 MAG: CvpA family protein [Rugosibacter sp.]
MTLFDYVVIISIAISILLGAWRGVVSEVLALAAWVVAFFVARAEASQVAQWLVGQIAEPGMRLAAAYLMIFVGVLLLFSIARKVISMLLSAVGLGLLDRLLGAFFGIFRGVLVVMAGVMVAGMTPLPRSAWWQESVMAPPLETAVLAARPWLPAEAVKRIRFR